MIRIALVLAIMLAALPVQADPRITCRGPGGGHLGTGPACSSLTALLAGHNVTVTLELTRDEPQALAGRLVWQTGGRTVSGPVVEVTASERPLDARAGERLALGLVQVSDLP
ncbi:hypothetical protein [Gemmobacter nectariphilus]|uniref:hypothetical protein n=1 Tax=Gemmobacter nectariphilus TaxID=220343 RepID=UPI000421B565|nr:hypothetical protein [Gemmobacter nectariphilus]